MTDRWNYFSLNRVISVQACWSSEQNVLVTYIAFFAVPPPFSTVRQLSLPFNWGACRVGFSRLLKKSMTTIMRAQSQQRSWANYRIPLTAGLHFPSSERVTDIAVLRERSSSNSHSIRQGFSAPHR